MAERPRFVVVRVPGFGLNYSEARYYLWRHSIHIGWWIVFFWPIRVDLHQGDADEIDF